jgi:hypothetical protein
MRLSEAIRAGSKLRPHNTQSGYHEREGFDMERGEHIISSCALAAAAEAVNPLCAPDPCFVEDREAAIDKTLEVNFGVMLDTAATCPVCPLGHPDNLFQVIAHLNDLHCWTREEIADFVEEEYETVSV